MKIEVEMSNYELGETVVDLINLRDELMRSMGDKGISDIDKFMHKGGRFTYFIFFMLCLYMASTVPTIIMIIPVAIYAFGEMALNNGYARGEFIHNLFYRMGEYKELDACVTDDGEVGCEYLDAENIKKNKELLALIHQLGLRMDEWESSANGERSHSDLVRFGSGVHLAIIASLVIAISYVFNSPTMAFVNFDIRDAVSSILSFKVAMGIVVLNLLWFLILNETLLTKADETVAKYFKDKRTASELLKLERGF